MSEEGEVAGYSLSYNKTKSKGISIKGSFRAIVFEASRLTPKVKWQNLLKLRLDNLDILSEWHLEQDNPDNFEVIAKIDYPEDTEGLDKKIERAKKDIETAIEKTNNRYKELLSNSQN